MELFWARPFGVTDFIVPERGDLTYTPQSKIAINDEKRILLKSIAQSNQNGETKIVSLGQNNIHGLVKEEFIFFYPDLVKNFNMATTFCLKLKSAYPNISMIILSVLFCTVEIVL